MAVKIRLKRLGKIRSPHYRIVVADSRTKRDGRAIEEIGKYHPKNDPSFIEVNSERAQYWLSVGAQPTEAVVAILKRSGDWQQFSGDASPSGIDPQPEKKNKTDRFNAALAEAGGDAKPAIAKKSAVKTSDSAKKDSSESESESTKSESTKSTKSESAKSDASDKASADVEGTPEQAADAAEAGVAAAEAEQA